MTSMCPWCFLGSLLSGLLVVWFLWSFYRSIYWGQWSPQQMGNLIEGGPQFLELVDNDHPRPPLRGPRHMIRLVPIGLPMHQVLWIAFLPRAYIAMMWLAEYDTQPCHWHWHQVCEEIQLLLLEFVLAMWRVLLFCWLFWQVVGFVTSACISGPAGIWCPENANCCGAF